MVRNAVEEKNRLHHDELPETALASMKRHIQWINKETKSISKELQSLIEVDAYLKERQLLLESMKGIGRVVSGVLLAEFPELGTLNRTEQLATLIGVSPYERSSGKWKGKSHIMGGRHEVRQTLYMSVLSASRYCPEIKALYERLLKNGKAKKVAQVACIHKMLRMLNAMLAQGKSYKPQAS